MKSQKSFGDFSTHRSHRWPPDSFSTTSSSIQSHHPPERSHLELLVDRRFSKSSQRRRRYDHSLVFSNSIVTHPSRRTPSFLVSPSTQRRNPFLLYFPLVLLLISALLPTCAASQPHTTPATSSPPPAKVDDPSALLTNGGGLSEVLVEPPRSLGGSSLEKPVSSQHEEQQEELEEHGYITDFENVNFQKGTAVIDHYYQKLEHEELISDLVAAGTAQVYDEGRRLNYRKLLFLRESNSLYAVADAATLLKLEGQSLRLASSRHIQLSPYGIPNCEASKGCQERVEITVLARAPQRMGVFFCSSRYAEYPRGSIRVDESTCIIPNPAEISEELMQWENKFFSSSDNRRPPVMLVPMKTNGPEAVALGKSTPSEPFIYIASVAADSLRLSRLQMPKWGTFEMNFDGALFSPKSNFLFSEPASVVTSFETPTAVYFLIRETSKSRGGTRQVVSRVVRVCRGDRGGVVGISEKLFGTLAKADLICQSESANGERANFAFDFIQSAHWDPLTKRLYALFSTGDAGPHGTAICIYDLWSIEKVFRGPIANSNDIRRSNSKLQNSARPNPFPDVCERLAKGNLNAEELALSQMGTNFYLRYEPLLPLFGHAVAMSPTVKWNAIAGYRLPDDARLNFSTSVIWVTSDTHATQLVVHETHDWDEEIEIHFLLSTCETRRLRIGQAALSEEEGILQLLREGVPPKWMAADTDEERKLATEQILSLAVEGESVYIGTTHSIFHFHSDTCDLYSTEETCLTSGDPHCGWNRHAFRCLSRLSNAKIRGNLTLSIKGSSQPECKAPSRPPATPTHSSGWSAWQPCFLTNDLHPKPLAVAAAEWERSCLCRICLRDSPECSFGEQQVSQCKIAGVWSPWSSWSLCEDKQRFRTRTCFHPFLGTPLPSSECAGFDREEEFCLMRPFIPDEAGFETMRAEHAALKEASSEGITITRNHVIGMLVGIILGVVGTLMLVLLVTRFCRPWRRRRREHKSGAPVRLRFHGGSGSLTDSQLESQLRHSLLQDTTTTMYANPSLIGQSIHSTTSPRYNFILAQSTPWIAERISRSEESSTTAGFYDRLTEDNPPK